MYVPDLARVSPTAAGLPQAEEITLTTTDSERLVAWHVAPQCRATIAQPTSSSPISSDGAGSRTISARRMSSCTSLNSCCGSIITGRSCGRRGSSFAAMRRALSCVSTFACRVSFGSCRKYV